MLKRYNPVHVLMCFQNLVSLINKKEKILSVSLAGRKLLTKVKTNN